MFRRYAMALLTLAAVACGDDEPAKEEVDAGNGPDAGAPVVAGKVTNTGAACAALTDCQGKTSTCLTNQTVATGAINFTGGYCSAQCTADAECNAGDSTTGQCPFAATIAMPGLGMTLLQPISVCLKPCATEADCRGEGYKCDTVAAQVTAFLPPGLGGLAGPLLTGQLPPGKFCLSTNIVLPDAGLPPVDGGANDGGASDAGTTDGGLDGGATDGGLDGGATDGGADGGPRDAGDAGDAS